MFDDLLGALPEETECPDIEDSEFLAGVGIPEGELDDAYGWDGWTAGMVRKGLTELAYDLGIAPERLLTKALKQGETFKSKLWTPCRDWKLLSRSSVDE